MNNIDNHAKFIALIESEYTWPDYYTFKFVVQIETKDLVLQELTGQEVQFKYSATNKYVSITSKILINKTEEILEIYRRVGKIPGVMSL